MGNLSTPVVTKAATFQAVLPCIPAPFPADSLLYKLWGDLETAVMTGTNCWNCAFGLDSSDVFASVYQEDASILRFMRGMHGLSRLSAKAVLTAFDLSDFRALVDLGGATGALAAAACVMYPQLRAVVFDLPNVIRKAQQHFANAPGMMQGVQVSGHARIVRLGLKCSALKLAVVNELLVEQVAPAGQFL